MSGIHLQAPSSSILREIDEFFMKTGPVQKTLHNLDKRLSQEHIDYAVIRGMALALHGFVRPTLDADILLTKGGLERLREVLVWRGYAPPFAGAPKHYRDVVTGVKLEVIPTGEYPGDGQPKPVVFPEPGKVVEDKSEYPLVKLETLIQL